MSHMNGSGMPTDEADDGDVAFADRIARSLRGPERLDDTFEARVMSAIHAEVRAQVRKKTRSWWLREWSFTMSPVGGLAMAAGIAAIVFGAMRLHLPAEKNAVAVASAADTVQLVRFVFMDSSARAVSLVGDFNAWDKGQTPLVAGETPGTWTVSVTLPAGRHEYAFIVRNDRGERWVADPFAPVNHDEFGTESSVLTVGPTASRSAAGAS